MSTSTMTVGRAAVGASAPAVAAAPIDFDALVREHRPRLVRAAYRHLGNLADAEEAVQAALLKAWTEQDSFRDGDCPAVGWISVLGRWEALAVRSARARLVLTGGWEDKKGFEFEDRTVESNGLPCMAEEETRQRVFEALGTLSVRERQAVELHCLENLTTLQVAQRMGVTRATVGKLLWRAFYRLGGAPRYGRKPARGNGLLLGVESPVAAAVRARPDLLDRVTPRVREVLRLRYVERLPLADVAQRCGLSIASMPTTVNRARRAFALVLAKADA